MQHVLSRLPFKDLVHLAEKKSQNSGISGLITNNVMNSAIEWENWYLWKLQQQQEAEQREDSGTQTPKKAISKFTVKNLLIDVYENLDFFSPRYLDDSESAFPILSWPDTKDQIRVDQCT